MKILVCGGTDFGDDHLLYDTLEKFNITYLVIDNSRGAAQIAKSYAAEYEVECMVYYEDKHEPNSEVVLNNRMLNYNTDLDLVVAFLTPQSAGARDMVKQANAKGIEVLSIETYGHDI
jgi:hypothetical protein